MRQGVRSPWQRRAGHGASRENGEEAGLARSPGRLPAVPGPSGPLLCCGLQFSAPLGGREGQGSRRSPWCPPATSPAGLTCGLLSQMERKASSLLTGLQASVGRDLLHFRATALGSEVLLESSQVCVGIPWPLWDAGKGSQSPRVLCSLHPGQPSRMRPGPKRACDWGLSLPASPFTLLPADRQTHLPPLPAPALLAWPLALLDACTYPLSTLAHVW